MDTTLQQKTTFNPNVTAINRENSTTNIRRQSTRVIKSKESQELSAAIS